MKLADANVTQKFKLTVLVLCAILTFATIWLTPNIYAKQNGNNTTTCTLHKSVFLGFPTWYKYLKGQPETVTPESQINTTNKGYSGGVNTVTSCVPQFDSISDVWLVVAAVIDMLLYLGGLGAVFMVIYGGVRYTTSMGSPEATAQARNTIIYALIGLVIAISASFIVTFIAQAVGAS
ncbi:pilin [Patescibacteria group bacterium]|nr:pilin [Patescibacteria group bacterium]